jgi:chemotaxis protein histidine kinase CheA
MSLLQRPLRTRFLLNGVYTNNPPVYFNGLKDRQGRLHLSGSLGRVCRSLKTSARTPDNQEAHEFCELVRNLLNLIEESNMVLDGDQGVRVHLSQADLQMYGS